MVRVDGGTNADQTKRNISRTTDPTVRLLIILSFSRSLSLSLSLRESLTSGISFSVLLWRITRWRTPLAPFFLPHRGIPSRNSTRNWVIRSFQLAWLNIRRIAILAIESAGSNFQITFTAKRTKVKLEPSPSGRVLSIVSFDPRLCR